MDIFIAIKDFYDKKTFFDVKLKSGLDSEEIFGHCIVLSSAVPSMGQVLLERLNENGDEDLTLLTVIFPECSGQDLKKTVDEIYSALAQEIEVDDDKLNTWAETLCFRHWTVPDEPELCRVSKRAIKKRKIFEPDVGPSKRVRSGGRITKVAKRASHDFGLQEEHDVRTSYPHLRRNGSCIDLQT